MILKIFLPNMEVVMCCMTIYDHKLRIVNRQVTIHVLILWLLDT